MDYDLLYPGKFLKAAEFKGKDWTGTITGVRVEELEGDKGKRMRGIISFAKTPKELVLNRTNGECLKGMFGRETDQWIGKRVTFYPAPFVDNFGGDQTTCIRVRGSPDLKADVSVVVHLARKTPRTVVMKRTGQVTLANPAKKGAPPPPPPPEPEEHFEEPPDDVPLPTLADQPKARKMPPIIVEEEA